MIRQIGKEGRKWLAFRKKFLKGKEEWDGRYLCSLCKIPTEFIEIDHIQKRSSHPELKYEVSNLRLICRRCHIEETKKKP